MRGKEEAAGEEKGVTFLCYCFSSSKMQIELSVFENMLCVLSDIHFLFEHVL